MRFKNLIIRKKSDADELVASKELAIVQAAPAMLVTLQACLTACGLEIDDETKIRAIREMIAQCLAAEGIDRA